MTLILLLKVLLIAALVSGIVLSLSFIIWTVLFAFVAIGDYWHGRKARKVYNGDGYIRNGSHVTVGMGKPLDTKFTTPGLKESERTDN